jgi:hypothetical protein
MQHLDFEECAVFWQPEGHHARCHRSPSQKRNVSANLNVRISLRASGLKEEAECCAQVVQASGTQATPNVHYST